METNWYKDSKYDCYGNLIERKKYKPDIKKGDEVKFIYPFRFFGKKQKITCFGIWDGEKVCFNDINHTIVRTTEWLTLVPKEWSVDYS
jgi:hypothetical protein